MEKQEIMTYITKRGIVLFCLLVSVLLSCSPPSLKRNNIINLTEQNWKLDVKETLKVFGHRNWIVIADAAYPEQSNPAIKTITIDASQLEVVKYVKELIEGSNHVHATIFIDNEMAFVSEKDAKGISAYRENLDVLLAGKDVKTKLHEAIIKELDNSAKLFNVLIIKTDLTIPYTSVFFQLECGYWNAASEKTMRVRMGEIFVN